MYCPECGVEYRAGFTECSDCHAVLVEQAPPAGEAPSPDLELVRVLAGNSPIAAAVAKTVLDEAGIPFYLEGEDTGGVLPAMDPHIYRWWGVQVARDHEAEARKLLVEAVASEDLALDVDQEPVEVIEDPV